MASPPHEFDLISTFLAPLAGAPGLGLRDDAALFTPPPGHDLAMTTDSLVAGRHFFADDPPDAIAEKALAVNLSDLAAMGARPLGYLLAATFPAPPGRDWLTAFCDSLRAMQQRHAVELWGGDTTTGTEKLVLGVTAIGAVPTGCALTRSGARPGDRVFVSGTIGDACLGLDHRTGKLAIDDTATAQALALRLHRPTPRLSVGQALQGLATAAADVSDGLVADLGHIASASAVSIVVDGDAVPLSDAARGIVGDNDAILARVLGGGDDYELVFCVPPARADAVGALARRLNVPLTEIGRVEDTKAQAGTVRVVRNGHPFTIDAPGFRHF